VVINALTAELNALRELVGRQIEEFKKPLAADESLLLEKDELGLIFPAMIPKLGVLPTKTVKTVVDTYMSLRTYDNVKALLCSKRGVVAERYHEVTASVLPKIKTATESLPPKIDAALAALRNAQ
jgi:hypothetical protein